MSAGTGLIRQCQNVLRLAQPPRWSPVTIVVLGLTAAGLEGAGLYLFIPLMQSLGVADSGHVLSRAFARVLEPIPAQHRPLLLVAGLCLSIVAKNAVSYAGGYVARLVDGLVAHRLRARVFAQTLSSCADYRPEARITDMVTTLTNNTWKVSQALSLIFRLIICACTVVVFFGLLLVISVKLTLLAAVMLVVVAALAHLVTHRAQAVGKEVVEENKSFGLRMWESVNALQLIRSFGREDYEVRRFSLLSDRVRRRILTLDMMWAMPAPIAEVAGAVLIGALILAGIALGGGLAPLAAFLAVLYRLQGPTRELMQSKVALDGLAAAVRDVDEYLRATQEPPVASGPSPARSLEHGVSLRDVSFRYGPHEPRALDGVSLVIPAGKTTAIVGRSGAGKSTLAALLFRFRDPDSGVILADETPLRELDVASWRARVSLMPQEAVIFHDTAMANIAYGRLEASEAAVREAARVAGADDFIMGLPSGYDTVLGDRGARLSGGQKQRIALARTILKDPDLLLLDEPTNALDPETEQAFQTALQTFAHGRTVVVIAHRLSTVMAADQVVVLEEGRVVDQGPPSELLKRPGWFARMYNLDAHPARAVA